MYKRQRYPFPEQYYFILFTFHRQHVDTRVPFLFSPCLFSVRLFIFELGRAVMGTGGGSFYENRPNAKPMSMSYNVNNFPNFFVYLTQMYSYSYRTVSVRMEIRKDPEKKL